MPQIVECLEQPAGEALHARVNEIDADRADVAQPALHGRQVQVVDGAVLERGGVGREIVRVRLHRGDLNRPSRKPRPAQLREHRLAHEQAADPGRVAEHLVEGERDEVRPASRQVEPVCGNERRGVEDHVPSGGMRFVDDLHRVLHAAEIRLRGVGEELVFRRHRSARGKP